MKISLLSLLVLSLALTSCGDKSSAKSASSVKGRIVLGAFNDMTMESTYDVLELQDLPRVVNLNSESTKAKNQSDRGTCTFFATAGLIENAIKKDLKKEVNISEEYMNYKTKSMGYFTKNEGSVVQNNIYAIRSGGFLLEKDWAYQPSWFNPGLPCAGYTADNTSSPAKCFSHNAPDAVAAQKIFPATGLEFGVISKNTNDIIKFLAEERRSLTLSVSVNFNGWSDSGNVYHNERLRQECLNNPSECGGHAIILTGYDLDKEVFFFKNSWGEEWGQKGFGTITFDTVDRFTTEPLYYVTATESFKVPAGYDQDNLSLESFEATPAINNSNLSVAATGKLVNAQGRMTYVSSFIVKKAKNQEAPNDQNVQVINPSAPLKAVAYFQPTLNGVIGWDASAPLVLNYSNDVLAGSAVSYLLNSETEEAYLRTTIYVHTDDSSYKTLKRIYQPIK